MLRLNLGLRSKLFLASLAVIGLSVTALDIYLRASIERELTLDVQSDLMVRAQLVRLQVDQAPPSEDLADWDALADSAGLAAKVRLTLLDRHGRVAGDSTLGVQAFAAAEDQALQPEFVDALRDGVGTSTRIGTANHQRIVYVAVRTTRPGPVSVVRLSEPLDEVDAALRGVRGYLLLGAAVALAAAAALSTLAATWMSRSIRPLTEVARAMSSGNLDVRATATTKDEAGELGRVLDRLAEGQKRALSELRDERDRLAHVLEAMREGVLLIEGDGRVSLANPAIRGMLLLQDVIGKTVLEVVRHADLKRLLDNARDNPEPVSEELDIGDLKPKRLLVHASRVGGDSGEVLAVFVDMTDLRKLEALRRDFVANVSHELRTPIATVRAAAETLRQTIETHPDEATEFVEIVERNAERLQRLVEDLLDLSRIESRQYKVQLEPTDTASVARHVCTLFQSKADIKRMQLVLKFSPGLRPALVDRRALEQILTNLIDNAIKYAGEGRTVTIGGSMDGAAVRLTVADDGPGIGEKHLPRLFERFYRVDAGRSRDIGGTGLGLSIVKHLAEAMYGKVWVESSPGRGTVFSVTIPSDS